MTTIRKIVTSQVDGNSANTDDNNEVRPFGEASFYIDTSGNTDKLVLSMFEGQRTHLRSKVLSPGLLFGSNADSGDGIGLDTIKLIPDASLHYNDGSYGNDQHIVIDPTGPNHIHIRAGGTIDNSGADLYIGGELNNVVVSDSGNTVSISTDAGEGNTKIWIFDNNSRLILPATTSSSGPIVSTEAFNNNGNIFQSVLITPDPDFDVAQGLRIYPTYAEAGHLHLTANTSTVDLFLGDDNKYVKIGYDGIVEISGQDGIRLWGQGTFSNAYIDLPSNTDGETNSLLIANYTATGVLIQAGTDGPPHGWQFSGDGSLIFPDSTVQTTAFTGTSALLDITDTNGLGTTYYPTFVETRDVGQIVRADVDLTYRTDDNLLSVGNISVNSTTNSTGTTSGALTVAGGVGIGQNLYVGNDAEITGNVSGSILISTNSVGNEGGEIRLAASENATIGGVIIDSYNDVVRIFESTGTNRGVRVDLAKAPDGNVGELMWKVSDIVNSGTFVTLDNLKVTVPTTGNRGLSVATVSGSFFANIGAWYGGSGGTGGDSVNNLSVTTTESGSLFSWNFVAEGNSAQYTIYDKTNNRMYRVTLMIGPAYLNNFISIERLL